MWSITAAGLSALIGDLTKLGIFSSSVRQLQQTLRDHRIYPARDFAHRCTPAPPDAFFTYHSTDNYVDVQEIVWRTFDFCAVQLRRRRPELDTEMLEPLVASGIRLWLDFVFIDQSARDLVAELDVLPALLEASTAHFVLGSRPLRRGWCAYEIGLFNRQCATSEAHELRSFIAPSLFIYHGWDLIETTEPEDKQFIAENITAAYPGGFAGFNHVMQQANGGAALTITEGHPFYTPASLHSLGDAAEAWYDRSVTVPSGGTLP